VRLSARLVAMPNGNVDTLTHLALFGMAITGDPLLELKPVGSGRCAES